MLDKFAAASIRSLVLIIIFLGFTACHDRIPPEFQPPPQITWSNEFNQRWEQTLSYRAQARVTLLTAESKFPGRMTFVLKKPGNIRADFFDPFGRLKGLVIISGRRVFEYMPEGISGASKPGELSILAGMSELERSAPAEELASLITGLPGNLFSKASFRWENEAEYEKGGRVENGLAGTIIFLSMHGENPVVSKIISRDLKIGGEMVVSYDKYNLINDIPLPTLVTVAFPDREWVLKIQYRILELNVDIDDELFTPGIKHGS